MAGPDPTVGVGPFGINGALSGEQVSDILASNKYKGWLYLLPEDGPGSPVEAVKEAGLDFDCIPVSVPDGLTKGNAERVVRAVESLPRPTMLQCASGARASAALLFFLAHQQKLGPEGALSLGSSLGLKCAEVAPMVKWIGSAVEPQASGASDEILFRHLFDKESSTNTYLLADPHTKEAVILDPVLEQVDRDLATIDDLGLNLLYAINTHCHADHVTGTGEIKKRRPGVRSGISKSSKAEADILYEAGDVIRFGAHQLEVIPTPGHTAGCVTYYCESRGGMCFTGDALLIRGCGRTDFQEGDPSTLYDSVHERLFSLPDSTAVYPAHDYKGRTCSTVGEEKRHNPRLTKPKQEFIEIMNNLGLPYPKKLDVAHPANMVCGLHEVTQE